MLESWGLAMTEREALKLALEALEKYAHDFGSSDLSVKAMYVARNALAQPEQEPVAWRFQSAVGGWAYGKEPPIGSKYAVEPLYTTPPQRTDQEQQIETLKRCLFQMQEAAKNLVEQAKSLPPPQRKPLTDEELSEIYNRTEWDTVNGWEYERAIEAAHGIKGEE